MQHFEQPCNSGWRWTYCAQQVLVGQSGPCTAQADVKGRHTIGCCCAGLRVQSHDDFAKVLAGVLRSLGASSVDDRQPAVALPDGTSACADLAYSTPDGTLVFGDVTIVSATSAQALRGGSAKRDGVACAVGEQAKRKTYQRRPVAALVVERGGRFGRDLHRLLKTWLPSDASRSVAALRAQQNVGCLSPAVQC